MNGPLSPADFKAAIPAHRRLLGFDVGSKTIGLALSDILHTVASPLETIKRGKRFKESAEAIVALADKHQVGGLVYGWPVNMDGSEGPRCQATRDFARNMDERLGLPFLFWDERLSTAAVERTLVEADRSRARRAELVDKLVASYILQGALHSLT